MICEWEVEYLLRVEERRWAAAAGCVRFARAFCRTQREGCTRVQREGGAWSFCRSAGFQVFGELAHLLCGDTQGLATVAPHFGNDFVVHEADEPLQFGFDLGLGGLNGLVYFAAEVLERVGGVWFGHGVISCLSLVRQQQRWKRLHHNCQPVCTRIVSTRQVKKWVAFVLLGLSCACCAQTKAQQEKQAKEEADHPPPPRGSCHWLWNDTPAEAPLQALTPKQKFKLGACDFLHPFTYIYAAGDAAISTAANPDSAYGPSVQGAGKRFGVDMTDEVSNDFFSVFLIPAVFKQDPHFHPLGEGHPTKRRVAYAMTRVLFAKKDDGKGNTLNYGELLGTTVTSVLANTYHPGQTQGFRNTGVRIGVSIASDSAYNIWKEYEPQFERKFRLQISVVRRLAQKVAARSR